MPSRHAGDTEREHRRTTDRERLERAVAQLTDSDGWKRWVRVRSKNGLARYSFGNQLLIALQRPDATFVAGYRAFLELDRRVREGEKAIRILAPITPRKTDTTETNAKTTDHTEGRRTRFRTVCVFDVAQTEPQPGTEPVPLEPPAAPVTGETHTHLLRPLRELANNLGYTVTFQAIDSAAEGWCNHRRKEITISRELSANGQVRVLIHEIAHAHGIGYEQYGRGVAEVLVDTVTYIVCSTVGLDVSGSSVPYIAGWGEQDAAETIRRYAEIVDRAAGQIEHGAAKHEPDRSRRLSTSAGGAPTAFAAPHDVLIQPPDGPLRMNPATATVRHRARRSSWLVLKRKRTRATRRTCSKTESGA